MIFRRINIRFALFVMISMLATACQTDTDEQKDSESELIPNEYAKGFQIEKLKEGVHRIGFINIRGEIFRQFVVLKDSVPFKNTLDEQIYHTPIHRVACQSTTHTAFFDALGVLDRVKGICYGQLVKQGELRERLDDGTLINLSSSDEIDFELLVGLEPEMLFVYPFGNGKFSKIEDAGIPAIPISEYQEETPLGQAEWIKVFGLITGEKVKADSLFDVISNRYEKLATFIEKESVEKPTVITGSFWKNTWKAPSANSLISQYINDAGGDYLIKDTSVAGNLELDFESFFVKAIDADYFGKIFYADEEVTKDKLIENDERLEVIESYKTDNFFYCPSLETDYFIKSAMQPDLVLMDLMYIFHPKLMKNHVPVYFRKIESEN